MTHSGSNLDKAATATLGVAEDWLGADTLRYKLLQQTMEDLTQQGWELHQWDAPEDKSVAAFSVSFTRGKRFMEVTVRSEWPRGGEPVVAAFVDCVHLRGFPKPHNMVSIPVADPSATHVSRTDPLATAVALALATDEELYEMYAPDAVRSETLAKLNAGAADILRDLKG